MGVPFGLSGTSWMMEIAALIHGTESELILKSRRVVPTRLTESGFAFEFSSWDDAAADLVRRPQVVRSAA
jgi:NAD dependent epimerase/dehydratase family enzyme